jgi:hypothetical protein
MADQSEIVAIQGSVVGQYFGLFDGVSNEDYGKIVAPARFDRREDHGCG